MRKKTVDIGTSTYVLALGVGNGLQYAELDAERIARYFARSALAPAAECRLMTGGDATRAMVRAQLMLLGQRRIRPRALVLFFSGHGEREGIWLADGLLTYRELRTLLRATGIERTVLLLDTCHAGAIIGGDKYASVAEDYLAAIVAAAPGVRIFASARADEYSYESDGVGGRFTSALLWATQRGSSDLLVGETWFASDAEIFRLVRERIASQWGHVQTPVAHGVFGDFPLARAQDLNVVGRVGMSALVPCEDGSVRVVVSLAERRLVPCEVRLLVLDGDGRMLARDDGTYNPIVPVQALEQRAVTRTARAVSPGAAAVLRACAVYAGSLRWRMEVVDAHGDVLVARERLLGITRRVA